ncbi:unnamed protein product [Camellia sinensis]
MEAFGRTIELTLLIWQRKMVSGVSRKRPTASNRRRAKQTEPKPMEVNVPTEKDDHVDVNNDYVDDDIGVEDDDVDNDIGVEADLMEDDVGVDDENIEPVPGAPEDPSLLISFRNHVAATVWKKKERGPLKCLNRSRKLAEWPWMSPTVQNVRWRHLVEQSGLSVLIDHTYRHGNRVAISAFIERWHPETNTFHMPNGEMTITLDDVRTILCIPVTGMALSCPKLTRYKAAELVNATVGVPVNDAFTELVQSRGQSVKLECESLLAILIGCTLFADKSGTRVPVAYLHMLTDIDAVSSYACNDAAFNVGAAVHRLGHDECDLHPDMLYETIGRMLQVLDGQSLGSTSTRTEHQVYYRKRRRMDRT